MRITVFGASGAIGQQVVALAAQRGHTVRAVYRTSPPVPLGNRVEILVSPDIFQDEFVTQAIRDANVVITALGPNFAQRHNAQTKLISPPDLHQRLARALVRAMQQAGTPTKVIAVSTGSMGPADAIMPLGPRLLLGFLRTVIVRNLRVVGKDLTAMEQELATSGLDWYAVRPVKLTDGPLTEHVHAGERFALRSISRADVAWYLLTLAEAASPPQTRTPILVSASHRPAPVHEREAVTR
jgi:uncharacterized protein YbjT (DUF2867 family)